MNNKIKALIISVSSLMLVGAGLLDGRQIRDNSIDIESKTTGILPISKGGTGTDNLTTDSIPEGDLNKYMTQGRMMQDLDSFFLNELTFQMPLSYNSLNKTISLNQLYTDDIIERNNLYFTQERSRGSISAVNPLSYNSNTGVLSLNQLNTDNIVESNNLYFTESRARNSINATAPISYNSNTGNISLNQLSTDNITESSNLYFTQERARNSINATAPISYNSNTGNISLNQLSTNDIVEGVNLYFTQGRARLSITVNLPLTYNSTTGVISINQASSTQDGYITSNQFNTFNNKINSVNGKTGNDITLNLNEINIPVSNYDMNSQGFNNLNYIDLINTGTIKYLNNNIIVPNGNTLTIGNTNSTEIRLSNGNFGINGNSYGGGNGVIFLRNSITAPTTNPVDGVILYAQNNNLLARTSAGRIRTVVNN